MAPHTLRSLPGALIASAALLAGTLPTTAPSVQASQAPSAATREFTNPAERREKKKKRAAVKKDRSEPWRFDKLGNARDGVGNYRSSKRLRRLLLTSIAGVPNTGRQWVKLQKALRRHAPQMLAIHPRDLMRHPRARLATA